MNYQEFDALPAFQFVVFQNGSRMPSLSTKPMWSHVEPPPDIEADVDVCINLIGLARVIGLVGASVRFEDISTASLATQDF